MDGDGGNGNPFVCNDRGGPAYDPGENGETGEDCGNINIYDSLKVLAYGGGGGGGSTSSNGSGRWGRWISCCRYRSVAALVGGRR